MKVLPAQLRTRQHTRLFLRLCEHLALASLHFPFLCTLTLTSNQRAPLKLQDSALECNEGTLDLAHRPWDKRMRWSVKGKEDMYTDPETHHFCKECSLREQQQRDAIPSKCAHLVASSLFLPTPAFHSWVRAAVQRHAEK